MNNPESVNNNLKPRSKVGTIFLYLIGPCIATSFLWFLGSLFSSNRIIWIILLFLNAFIGIFTTFILTKNRRAYLFFQTRSIWIICTDLPLVYLCYLGLSYWLGTKTTIVFLLLIITSIIGWTIQFFYASKYYAKNIDKNIKNGVIDLESAQWNIQYQEILSTKDNDRSRVENFSLLSKYLTSLGPPIILWIMRDYPGDQKLSFMTVVLIIPAILLFSISGESAGLSKFVCEIEAKIKQNIMIKTLE
jgi:hypothetical protein